MNNRLYGNLIFELSQEGRRGYSLPKNRFGHYEIPEAVEPQESHAGGHCAGEENSCLNNCDWENTELI